MYPLGALARSVVLLSVALPAAFGSPTVAISENNHHKVLILGGGVTGIIAARELVKAGLRVEDVLIVEARSELGGRLRSTVFGNPGHVVELGANWVEGTTSDTGKTNPIYELATKYGVKTVENNWDDILFYDQHGINNGSEFSARFDAAADLYEATITTAGERIERRQVDLTARSGYKLSGERFTPTAWDKASEYFNFDWEYAQNPEQSSWMATANNYNGTFDPVDGFGDQTLMCIDQQGFKKFIQGEAKTYKLHSLLDATITSINYTTSGSSISIAASPKTKAQVLTADHVLVTFSVGVLQHDDVVFHPPLPDWKVEAVESMKMGTYTKIFLQFEHKWWSGSEMGLFAHPNNRGYYPVWQSLDHARFFPGSHIYFVTVTGDESERIETMSDAAVQAEVLEVLRTMYPNITVPNPTSFMFQRWFSDPLYRGSFSNWPPSFYIEHMDNMRATVDTLHFAGEATSLKYYGYLHGAYYEGLERGQAIAKCVLKGKECDGPKGSDVFDKNLGFPAMVR